MNVNKQSLIEGIGDEVLFITAILAIVIFVLILWISKGFDIFLNLFRPPTNGPAVLTSTNLNDNINTTDLRINEKGDNTDNAEKNDGTTSNENTENTEQGNNSNTEGTSERLIQIKIKYLDDKVRTVEIDPSMTVGKFKSEYFKEDMKGNKNVRLIFNGKELKEINGETLVTEYGIVNGSTIHCLITKRKEPVPTNSSTLSESNSISGSLHIGSLLFPLLGLMLSLMWYYRLNYKHHFSTASTCVLVILSFAYFISCFFTYSTSPTNPSTTSTTTNNSNNDNNDNINDVDHNEEYIESEIDSSSIITNQLTEESIQTNILS